MLEDGVVGGATTAAHSPLLSLPYVASSALSHCHLWLMSPPLEPTNQLWSIAAAAWCVGRCEMAFRQLLVTLPPYAMSLHRDHHT